MKTRPSRNVGSRGSRPRSEVWSAQKAGDLPTRGRAHARTRRAARSPSPVPRGESIGPCRLHVEANINTGYAARGKSNASCPLPAVASVRRESFECAVAPSAPGARPRKGEHSTVKHTGTKGLGLHHGARPWLSRHCGLCGTSPHASPRIDRPQRAEWVLREDHCHPRLSMTTALRCWHEASHRLHIPLRAHRATARTARALQRAAVVLRWAALTCRVPRKRVRRRGQVPKKFCSESRRVHIFLRGRLRVGGFAPPSLNGENGSAGLSFPPPSELAFSLKMCVCGGGVVYSSTRPKPPIGVPEAYTQHI